MFISVNPQLGYSLCIFCDQENTYNDCRNKLLSEKRVALATREKRCSYTLFSLSRGEHHLSLSFFSLTHSQSAECGKSKSDGAERMLCFVFFLLPWEWERFRSKSCQIRNPEAAARKMCARCFTTLGRAPINFYDVAGAKPEPPCGGKSLLCRLPINLLGVLSN
jgi:hypothetical protein